MRKINISNVVVTFGVGVNQFSRKVDRIEKVFHRNEWWVSYWYCWQIINKELIE